MSIDIFSLKAFENISEWIKDWSKDWENALNNVKDRSKIPNISTGKARFIGYVTQQYMAKRDSNGMRRPVVAYEKIRSRIDRVIETHLLEGGFPPSPYEIGTVPNLFSLIPMSQSKNTPVFELTGADGVVGAHFAKVKDAKAIFAKVSEELLGRLSR